MQQSTSNPRERSVTGAPFAAPGTRTDRSGDEVRSRSADPGQSSYGGFKNENPSYQRQGDAARGSETGPARNRVSYSDDRILDRVCERLWRAGLDVSEVSVRVEGGHVTLEGQVGSRTARRQIEACVDGCQGVSDIENRIRVAPDRTESQG
ncbi:BON domain-containing protein [Cupriavidus sp. UGS-1]|uniref:BON domain-containing protein n=1 Tax=Cupriavidus sp. UGS-1 TaxID=2899826 RepID=UPI001E5B0043|nr:BON domain-containing protein [Cupriavidus sp. UGS-1]MCD9122678.1 BON domain-containing protein [Cupriavidus sp. UGS-1]